MFAPFQACVIDLALTSPGLLASAAGLIWEEEEEEGSDQLCSEELCESWLSQIILKGFNVQKQLRVLHRVLRVIYPLGHYSNRPTYTYWHVH